MEISQIHSMGHGAIVTATSDSKNYALQVAPTIRLHGIKINLQGTLASDGFPKMTTQRTADTTLT